MSEKKELNEKELKDIQGQGLNLDEATKMANKVGIPALIKVGINFINSYKEK